MDVTFDKEELREAIITRVSDRILEDWDYAQQIRNDVRVKVDAVFSEVATKSVADAVAKAVDDGFDHQYFKTTSFGQKEGAATTIRKELEALVGKYWSQAVDRNGKPTADSYNSISRSEWMMMQVCGEKFSADMKQAAVNATAQLKDGLRIALQDATGKMLNDLFRVRTVGEKYP